MFIEVKDETEDKPQVVRRETRQEQKVVQHGTK